MSDAPNTVGTQEGTGEGAGDSTERADLVQALGKQRFFLRHTVNELTDEQAAKRTTVSELCLGGLVKHVAQVELGWASFIIQGPERDGQLGREQRRDTCRLLPDARG